jgi:hypothetical protein
VPNTYDDFIATKFVDIAEHYLQCRSDSEHRQLLKHKIRLAHHFWRMFDTLLWTLHLSQ